MRDLSGQKVLVAGGAGFVGSQLVRELCDAGAKVIVYDNFLHGTRQNLEELKGRIQVVIGDVLDEYKLFETFRHHAPRYAFTLVGDTSRVNRPSFTEAAAPELAEPLYERLCERLLAEGVTAVERGRFGTHMQVELVNDGPVTIVVEV